MVIDVAPARRHCQHRGEGQAQQDPVQASDPAAPLVVMLHPVRVGFEESHLRFQ